MKISIGMNLQPGAWGGGNRFGTALAQFLESRGHEVVFDLQPDDLDIILLAEPDRKLKISAYDHGDILRYLLFVNRRALVVHRINNTSEARDDLSKQFNRYRIMANRVADHTVFVSRWVHQQYEASGFGTPPYSVILNGADHHLWHPSKPKTSVQGRLKLVTHHWSKHPNKGIEIYRALDALLDKPPWSEQLEFTYVGSLPEGFAFRNSRHVAPLSGQPLADELRSHDAYITAALYEAGPNHVLEGGGCGLPLLYLDSGSMAEYCTGFGLEYTPHTLEEALTQMIANYETLAARMSAYPFTSERMCQHYLELFEQMIATRKDRLAARRLRASWSWVIRTLLDRDRRR
ncbi:MAG: glycosyltransferase [Magnetococcales bacterium]|nr:glycosyltransferase [Magnetococcales bacterium]